MLYFKAIFFLLIFTFNLNANIPTSFIDPDGNSVEFTHNIEGCEEIVKDKLGRISIFVYDDEGNIGNIGVW